MGDKQKHKEWRRNFRSEVIARDRNQCVICGQIAQDAHHITDRHQIPNGGYVPENGISLCGTCHTLAEQFHATGTEVPGYGPNDLYRRIGSSREKAFAAAEKLGK